MTAHYDARETREPAEREREQFQRLPGLIARAMTAPGWVAHLAGVEPAKIASRAALATLPVLRKSALPAMQKTSPPFAGLYPDPVGAFSRLFSSPGPIYEPEAAQADPWRAARALFAAGARAGDVVLNTFSYHLTPGGFIMDSAARALGCAVIPAGPGNTEQTLDAVAHLRPSVYCGTPDFLKILLDKATERGSDASSLKRALVSGAAFPPSLQAEIRGRGIDAYQAFAVAEIGVVAYESDARDGLIVNEDVILEIVRPGTGDPVRDGDVGEMLVTLLDPRHPAIRLALGDMTASLAGASPCGRTGPRIRGWMGRADQTAKVKGMFVRPEQIAEVGRRHPELGRLRLVVTRAGEQDQMLLRAETPAPSDALAARISETLASATKLKGAVEFVKPGALPNDGKVIADERPLG
jgi:phenylacetate-CoA ligase